MSVFSTVKNYVKEITIAEGRIRRRRYIIRASLSIFLMVFIGNTLENNIFNIFILAGLLYFLLQTVKRLHDINFSGWWIVLIVIPVINILLGLFVSLKKGTVGYNRYGPDPKAKIIFN